MTAPITEPGSFRDREGRVFYADGDVFRALSARALAEWRALQETRFFQREMADCKVVATREAEPAPTPPSRSGEEPWAGVLAHRRIPFISYPYEWSFSMLQDAALLQLDLLAAALAEDFVLKDSSSYNVQWLGHRPVFIDVASFERLAPGEPWIGYLQFCQLFLYPLLLTAYKDVPFQPLLRGMIDGIEPEVIDALCSKRDLLRPGVLTHVHLQNRLKKRWADRDHSVRREVRDSGFSKQLIVHNVRRLRKLVAGLRWRRGRSTWSAYGLEHGYSDDDLKAKREFVRKAAEASAGRLLWDLGCNDGRFTRVASPYFESSVAMDADPLTIERLYLELRNEPADGASILPLVLNVVDPSPPLGWRGRERKAFEQRGSPDLTLALALIHHLVIGANVPLAELVEWLASFGSALVIEFVSKEDRMVKKLLLNKADHYTDYRRDFLEQCLQSHYRIVDRHDLSSGTRTLYYAQPREGAARTVAGDSATAVGEPIS